LWFADQSHEFRDFETPAISIGRSETPEFEEHQCYQFLSIECHHALFDVKSNIFDSAGSFETETTLESDPSQKVICGLLGTLKKWGMVIVLPFQAIPIQCGTMKQSRCGAVPLSMRKVRPDPPVQRKPIRLRLSALFRLRTALSAISHLRRSPSLP
jgi:hypothetical protein